MWVTTDRIRLTRDDSALASRWSVLSCKVEDKWATWHKVLDDIQAECDVASVAYDGHGHALAMLAAGSDESLVRKAFERTGARARRIEWHELDDRDVLRLLLNSVTSIADGTLGASSLAGSVFVTIRSKKRVKNQVIALELAIDTKQRLSCKVRTLTVLDDVVRPLREAIRGYGDKGLLKGDEAKRLEAAEKSLASVLSLPRYTTTGSGMLARCTGDSTPLVIRRVPGDFNKSIVGFIYTGNPDPEEQLRTKAVTLALVLEFLRTTYPEQDIRFERTEIASTLVQPRYDGRFDDALAAARIDVNRIAVGVRAFADEELQDVAFRFSEALSLNVSELPLPHVPEVSYVGRETCPPGSLRVLLVPDWRGLRTPKKFEDGYEVTDLTVTQAITKETASRYIRSSASKKSLGRLTARQLTRVIIQQLAVKSDCVAGFMRAERWDRLAFDSPVDFCMALDCRHRMMKKDGRRDVWERRWCILSVSPEGRMSYRSFGVSDSPDASASILESMVSDCEGKPRLGVLAVRSGLDVATVEDAGFGLLPDDMLGFLDTIRRGESAVRSGEARLRHLDSMLGVRTFVEDGDTFYYCGPSSHLNTKVARGIPVRVIREPFGKSELTDRILGMLDTEIGRLNSLMVWPYPVKYLREYANMEYASVIGSDEGSAGNGLEEQLMLQV